MVGDNPTDGNENGLKSEQDPNKTENDHESQEQEQQEEHSFFEDESEETKARKVCHIKALLKAFRPISIYSMVFGRFPFTIEPKPDGTERYVLKNKSFNMIYFVVTTAVLSVLAFCGTIGIVLLVGVEDSSPKDTCQETWKGFHFFRNLVTVLVSWSWVLLTFLGSMHLFLHGFDYIQYLHYWKKAIKIMDMDVTGGGRTETFKQMIVVLITVGIFIGVFAPFKIDQLNDGAVLVAQAVIQLFNIEDIGKLAQITLPKSRIKLYCTQWTSYHSWSVFGFCIQMYGLLASQSFLLRFRFFCGTLTQASRTWCARFQNALNKVEVDESDETKRRLALKEVLKDHLIIIQLFKVTDVTFGQIVVYYYSLIIAAFSFELLYVYNGLTFESCNMVLHKFDLILDNCPESKVPTLYAYHLREYRRMLPDFNSCNINQDIDRMISTFISLFYLVQTTYFFLGITLSAANASESAMQGFQILRRHGFMYCSTRKQRNFIHSLVLTYVHNYPIVLTANGYFNLSRPLVINVILVLSTWFVIAIQIRDMIDIRLVAETLCTDVTSTAAFNYTRPKTVTAAPLLL